MKITQLLQEDKVTLSLEVFPPKKDTAVEQVSQSVRAIAALHPDFMSVTYGAGWRHQCIHCTACTGN